MQRGAGPLWGVHHIEVHIHCSVHRNSMLIESNKTQHYAHIYLLLNYSTCFGRPSRPSSGVHKTVVAASGTDHTVWGASFLKRDRIRTGLGPSRSSPKFRPQSPPTASPITPCSKVHPVKATAPQLDKTGQSFYAIDRFTAVFTKVHHLPLSWARWMQSTISNAISLRSLLLLSSNLGLARCFSTFVRPRPGKFFFQKTRARSQQIYS